MSLKGKVWKYGDDVNTDVIFPGKYTYTITDPKEMALHALEDLDPKFAKEVKKGDIIVAGRNFGCGSSREQAATCLKYAGVGAVVAKSFARIFFRNAINQGLPLVQCKEAVENISLGEIITIDFEKGKLLVKKRIYDFPPLPESVLGILNDGGLIPHTRKILKIEKPVCVRTAQAGTHKQRRIKMTKYRIAWLSGDGIGNDVMEAAKIVLDKLKLDADYLSGDVGWEFWKKEGNPLPDRTIKILKETDCCLFGAITSKPKEEAEKELSLELKGKGYVYSSPIVKIRQEFELHTNIRPCKAYKGNPLNYRDDIDLVVFRENTEDLYSGVEFHPLPKEVMDSLLKNHPQMKRFKDIPLEDIALSCRIFTRKACQSIVRQAFKYARKYKRNSVTLIEKPNVIRETSGLMIREARKIASEYPEIELWETNVDAMCMWLVKNPQKYSVLASSNMFGDIISDLCAQLVGGLGFASSANIGDDYALFEPTHGSAPKYAGQYKVNPTAMLLTVKLMLEYLGEGELAERLENSIAQVIEEEKVRTYDLGGTASTLEVAQEVARKLS